MFVRACAEAPVNERGNGQTSYLLLAGGDFGSSRLAVTWVEALPGSQQPIHAHAASEQVYVIVSGRGVMIVGDEERQVEAGVIVFIPPRTGHAIKNIGEEALVYVSASSPPFPAEVNGGRWTPQEQSASGYPRAGGG
jgi:mannose-6-phosphate isomerase-like protein (cupin superfamily)